MISIILQCERKPNLDSAAYDKQIDSKVNTHSEKKSIYCRDSKTYWLIRIKETVQFFPFISIMENNASIIETYISLIPSLLNVFEMFQIRLSYDDDNEEDNAVEAIAINCSILKSIRFGIRVVVRLWQFEYSLTT